MELSNTTFIHEAHASDILFYTLVIVHKSIITKKEKKNFNTLRLSTSTMLSLTNKA